MAPVLALSDQPGCRFGRRFRIAISALSCSIIRASSALGRIRYFPSSSARALSNERRPFIALSIRSTIRRSAGSGDVGDRDFSRRDRFGKLRLARKRPRHGGLVSVFCGPGYLRGVGHGSNRCVLFCSATAALKAWFRYCDSPSHLLPNRNTGSWLGVPAAAGPSRMALAIAPYYERPRRSMMPRTAANTISPVEITYHTSRATGCSPTPKLGFVNHAATTLLLH